MSEELSTCHRWCVDHDPSLTAAELVHVFQSRIGHPNNTSLHKETCKYIAILWSIVFFLRNNAFDLKKKPYKVYGDGFLPVAFSQDSSIVA